ncbi:MAG: hypothetical protein NC489_23665 [Ruminococcus flavefaciens]|nr:hypothetical protein [Ruminococcus flavefaciens]
MEPIYDICEIIILAACCIFLYERFGRRARVREVKPERIPTKKEIRRQRKRERRRRKLKRWFRVPYRGNAKIIEYSKTAPYIESAWNEVEKEQHGKKRGSKKGRGI